MTRPLTKTWSLTHRASHILLYLAWDNSRHILKFVVGGAWICFLAVIGSSLLGCGINTEAVAPVVSRSELVSHLEPEYGTYNLSTVAPYDTVTLKIRGVSGVGMTLDLPVSFVYDTQYVAISPDGMLRAKAKVVNTPVIVSMSNKGVTRYDTILVSVIDTPPSHLARVTIEPNSGDSAKVTAFVIRPFSKNLRLVRTDSNNTTVVPVLVSIQSSNPNIATVTQSGNNVVVKARQPGRTMLHISTFAYGRGFRDSLAFTVGWPLIGYSSVNERYITGHLTPILSLEYQRTVVGVGACVVWRNMSSSLETDIVFDDPSMALPPDSATPLARADCQNFGIAEKSSDGKWPGGNITQPFHFQRDTYGNPILQSFQRARAFLQPGVYTYRSTKHDFVGTIVVCDEQNDSTCAPENYKWGVPEQ